MRLLFLPIPMHFSRWGAKRLAARVREQFGQTHSCCFLTGCWPKTSKPAWSTISTQITKYTFVEKKIILKNYGPWRMRKKYKKYIKNISCTIESVEPWKSLKSLPFAKTFLKTWLKKWFKINTFKLCRKLKVTATYRGKYTNLPNSFWELKKKSKNIPYMLNDIN